MIYCAETSQLPPNEDSNRCLFFGTSACCQHWFRDEAYRIHTHPSLHLWSVTTIQQGHLSSAGKWACKPSAGCLGQFCHPKGANLFTVPTFTLGSILKMFTSNFALILSLSAQIGWERVLRKRHFVAILLLFYLCTFSPSARLVFTPVIFLCMWRIFFSLLVSLLVLSSV